MTETVFHTPDEAEAAYYAAFEAADLDAMMNVWAEDEAIVCVHPVGGHHLRGQGHVLEGWVHVFSRELDMKITLSDVVKTVTGDLAVHSGLENIVRAGDPSVSGVVVFTNVYRRYADGWKMVLHHASPGPREITVKAPEGFIDDYDASRLH